MSTGIEFNTVKMNRGVVVVVVSVVVVVAVVPVLVVPVPVVPVATVDHVLAPKRRHCRVTGIEETPRRVSTRTKCPVTVTAEPRRIRDAEALVVRLEAACTRIGTW